MSARTPVAAAAPPAALSQDRFPTMNITPAGEQIARLRPRPALLPDEERLLGLGSVKERSLVSPFNPFVFPAEDSFLCNLKCNAYSMANCTDFPGIAFTKVVWVNRQTRKPVLVREIRNAEDARGVVWRGRQLALFTRYRGHQKKDPWLVHLNPPEPEIKLTYKARKTSEGNWLPFVFDSQLYVSYSLCPHRVLAVDAHRGNASTAFQTTPASCSRHDRGSATGFLDTDGTVVGLGHQKTLGSARIYWFFFFKRSATPPFEILKRSSHFRLPSVFNSRGRLGDNTQFSLSLRLGSAASIILDYSVVDKAALQITLSRGQFCNFTQWCLAA